MCLRCFVLFFSEGGREINDQQMWFKFVTVRRRKNMCKFGFYKFYVSSMALARAEGWQLKGPKGKATVTCIVASCWSLARRTVYRAGYCIGVRSPSPETFKCMPLGRDIVERIQTRGRGAGRGKGRWMACENLSRPESLRFSKVSRKKEKGVRGVGGGGAGIFLISLGSTQNWVLITLLSERAYALFYKGSG